MQRVNRILFYLKDMLYMLKMHAFAVLFILVCSCNLQRISIAFDEQKEEIRCFRLLFLILPLTSDCCIWDRINICSLKTDVKIKILLSVPNLVEFQIKWVRYYHLTNVKVNSLEKIYISILDCRH